MTTSLRWFVPLTALLAVACSDFDLAVAPVDVDPDEVTECGFTPVPEMPELRRYDCNPVFTTTGEDWAYWMSAVAFNHTEVLGHPFYQLWYVGWPEDASYGDYSLGYAVSDNGTDWQPHADNPAWPPRDGGDWDGHNIQGTYVEYDPNHEGYLMMYGGINYTDDYWGIGVAGSFDGQDWALSPANPVMNLSETQQGVQYCWPLSFTASEGRYDTYLAGRDATNGGTGCQIYRTRTSDVAAWSSSSELVYPAGDRGTWDDEGVTSAAVVEHGDRHYLFYVGFGHWGDVPGQSYVTAEQRFLGMAVSDDGGETWVPWSDEPLPIHLTEEGEIGMVAARSIGSRIHLWVQDRYDEQDGQAIGYYLLEP
jgi:hypothetical protein